MKGTGTFVVVCSKADRLDIKASQQSMVFRKSAISIDCWDAFCADGLFANLNGDV